MRFKINKGEEKMKLNKLKIGVNVAMMAIFLWLLYGLIFKFDLGKGWKIFFIVIVVIYIISGLSTIVDELKKLKNGDGQKTIIPFECDKAKYYWDEACSIYCKQHKKNVGTLTDEDEDIIWECSAHHILIFLTWLIENDFLNDLYKDHQYEIDMIKKKKISGFEFLMNNLDGVLLREDISKEVIGFVDSYYFHAFFESYSDYMIDVLNKCVLGTVFSWDDYDKIKVELIDVAYNNYFNKLQEDNID